MLVSQNTPKRHPNSSKMFLSWLLCLLGVFAFIHPAMSQEIGTQEGVSATQAAPKVAKISKETIKIFQRATETINPASLSDEELILACAKSLLNIPYPSSSPQPKKAPKAKRTPRPGEGRWLEDFPFIISLSPLDCMTFVEAVSSLARTLRTTPAGEKASFNLYVEDLRAMRFIEGRVTDFASRLHYASDWCFENEKNGRITNISKAIGGEPLQVRMVAMSEELNETPASVFYPQVVKRMRDRELDIEAREHWFVPNSKIKDALDKLKLGDIICFASNRGREDVEHMAIFAGMQEGIGSPTFIHASKPAKKAIIEPKGLERYAQERKDVKGLVVFRLILPQAAQK